jgi:LacI family transcriptional regulator
VLKARGLRPGIDIGVVGFDDLPRAAQEGLTSLTPPLATMGAEATRIALRMLKGEPVPRRTCLPWVLAPRASTARG